MELATINTAIESLNRAFGEYKQTNDQRLEELKTKGVADPLHMEKLTKLDERLDTLSAQLQEVNQKQARLALEGGDPDTKDSPDARAYTKAMGQYLRKGHESGLRDLEVKAMSVDSDPDGGYWVGPQVSARIVTRLRDTSPIRQYATIEPISSDSLEGAIDRDEADAGWVGERSNRPETGTPQIGVWRIFAHEAYAEPKTTQKILDDAARDVEGWLGGKIGDKLARITNTACVVGDGHLKPRGFATYPTSSAVDGSRADKTFQHVLSGASADFGAALAGTDTLLDLIYSLSDKYMANARFFLRRTMLAKVRKIKDGDGNYAWQPPVQAGQPLVILGFPFAIFDDIPALEASSLSLWFGDMAQAYTIVDRVGIRVIRDAITLKGWVKFYSTIRVGGDVLDFDALKVVKFNNS
jgi:HK97 family phage major capsid protein